MAAMAEQRLHSGVHLPNFGPNWQEIDLAGSARLVEEIGFDSIWLSDHIVLVDGAASTYPFSADGQFFLPADADWLEWTATAGFLAAHTRSIDIGVGVCVLPLRHPFLLAKQVATLDQLSHGRILLGVGAGWLAEEFEALGQDFASRGKAVEGSLQLLRQAWTGQPAAGEYGPYRVRAGVGTRPTPSRTPLPVYLGGESKAALRRTVQYGNGWYGTAVDGRMPIDHLRSIVRQIQALCEHHERDPAEIDIALRVAAPGREVGTKQFHDLLVGYVDAGVTRLTFDVGWRAPTTMEPRLTTLSKALDDVREATG